MSNVAKGRIIIIITALLWGLTGVCVKSITWSTPGIICARSVISLIMLYGYKFVRDKKADPSKPVRKILSLKFTRTNMFAALAVMVTSILYVQSIKMTTAGTAIVLQYIAPIFVFLFAVIFQKRKAKLLEVILTVGVFGGCVLSFIDQIDMTHMLGNILALLSGLTYAAQIIIMNDDKADSIDSMILSNMGCFLFCLPVVLVSTPLVWDAKNIIWLLILGIFQYGCANILFATGIKMIDKVEASLLLCIEPIFNPIPVAIFCGEMMGATSIIGAAVVIVCIALYGLLPKLEERKKIKKS